MSAASAVSAMACDAQRVEGRALKLKLQQLGLLVPF